MSMLKKFPSASLLVVAYTGVPFDLTLGLPSSKTGPQLIVVVSIVSVAGVSSVPEVSLRCSICSGLGVSGSLKSIFFFGAALGLSLKLSINVGVSPKTLPKPYPSPPPSTTPAPVASAKSPLLKES